jgi:Holliday junction resolvase RusA-like endonuclease
VQPNSLVFPVLSPGEAIAMAEQGEWSEWIAIPVNPIRAPRQDRNSHWSGAKKNIDAIQRYHQYRDSVCCYLADRLPLLWEGMHQVQVVFFTPMPKGCYTPKGALSAEGKRRIGKPHQVTPDTDNYLKAFLDSIFRDAQDRNDSQVWDAHPIKVWAVEGSVHFRWK